jgi:hypothetical protein
VLSCRVPPRKLVYSSFFLFPLNIWCSSAWKRRFCCPRFAHRRGTGVEVCRRAKCCVGNLYFLNLVLVICATYSASAPHGYSWGSVAHAYSFLWGNSNCDYFPFLMSPISFWFVCAVPGYNFKQVFYVRESCWCSQSNTRTGRMFVL